MSIRVYALSDDLRVARRFIRLQLLRSARGSEQGDSEKNALRMFNQAENIRSASFQVTTVVL